MIMTGNKVFVTGINGLLGTNLAIMLTERGFKVIGLVRKKSSFTITGLKNLELVEGDLSDLDMLIDKMKGCSYVVHIAAVTSQSLIKPGDYYQSNVKGTENIVKACIHNKTYKLVYIGTANTYGYGSLSEPGNEDKPMKAPHTKSLYALSKKQAQDIIDTAATELNITTISPTFMLGAYDSKPSSGRIILMALNKNLLFYPPGGKNFVHVKDVAEAITRAFELKQSGLKFIVANENLSYKDFFTKVVSINGQKTILIPVPGIILSLIGLLGDLSRLCRIETDLSSVNMKAIKIKGFYSNQKAINELNIKFTPVDKAIADSLSYFKPERQN